MAASEVCFLLAPDQEPETIVLTREERRKLWRRYQELEAEVERLRQVEGEFREYKKRHPETVGVKNGKAYTLTPNGRNSPKGKPGGRVGHPGRSRPRPDHVDEQVDVPVRACPRCHGTNLSEAVQETRSRFVEDLPLDLAMRVTEYLLERRYCRDCRQLVEAPLDGIVLPGARLGLNVMLLVGWMKQELRLTEAAIPELLETVLGLRVSEGEVIHVLEQLTEAFGPHYGELVAAMRNAPSRHLDSTSWRVQGENRYLWTVTTLREGIYAVTRSNGHEVPLELVGTEAGGTDVHDRHSAFTTLARKTRRPQQDCWAHILQDAKELAEFYGPEGEGIETVLREVYHEAKGVAGRGEAEADRLEKLLATRLEPHAFANSSHCRKFVTNLLKRNEWGWLFRFVVDPQVEPTNNRAERGLRPSVIARKIGGGSRSDRGAERYGILTSVFRSWRLRGWHPLREGRAILQTSHG